VREPMTSSRKSPAPRPAGRSGRAGHRCVWIFAVLGVGLLVAWLILRGVSDRQDADGAGRDGSGESRSDLFWAEPRYIIFCGAMVIRAVVDLALPLRLARRLLR